MQYQPSRQLTACKAFGFQRNKRDNDFTELTKNGHIRDKTGKMLSWIRHQHVYWNARLILGTVSDFSSLSFLLLLAFRSAGGLAGLARGLAGSVTYGRNHIHNWMMVQENIIFSLIAFWQLDKRRRREREIESARMYFLYLFSSTRSPLPGRFSMP